MKLRKRASASAAALAVGGTMVAGAPANADGTVCDGTQVRTCINVRYSTNDSRQAEAAARITDMPDGVDFDVKTTHVVLQWRKKGGTWSNARPAVKDFDGWHDREDLAVSKPTQCPIGWGPVQVRAKARFDWKRAGSDYEWAYSKPVNLNCAGG